MDETVFKRCCSVGLGAESLGGATLKADTGKGVEILAANVDGMSPAGCGEAAGTRGACDFADGG